MSGVSATQGTSRELETIRRLRLALKKSSQGAGLSAALVGALSGSRRHEEQSAVKKVLLGTPVEASLAGLIDGAPSGELLRFIATLSRFSSSDASKAAEKLSSTFDRWTLLKEKHAMEKKVMAFRGLIVSAVAGVVVGMISSLAPVISGFQLTLGESAKAVAGYSPFEGAVFLVPSSACLGLFLTPSRPYINVAVSLLAFVGAVSFIAPLATFSLGQ